MRQTCLKAKKPAQRILLIAPALMLMTALQAHPADAAHSGRHRHHVRHFAHVRVHSVRHFYVRHFVRTRASYVRTDARNAYAERTAAVDCVFTNGGRRICGLSRAMARAAPFEAHYGGRMWVVDRGTIIGSRPSDCPHAYCGCGLRKYLGISDARLNLAANWARLFPHESSPRAGLAAVRSHHVMYIERSAGDGLWVVRDYNSGGGLSRIHTMSVRGYAFVNPHVALARRYRVASHRTYAAGMDHQEEF